MTQYSFDIGFTVGLDEYIPPPRIKVSGIYAILNTVSGKLYIGKSDNLRKRKLEHKNALKDNRHDNILLTRAYEKYGFSAFRFVVIHTCPVEDLPKMEGYFVNKYDCCNPKAGYNLQELDLNGNPVFTQRQLDGLTAHYHDKRIRGDYSVTWDIVNAIRKDNNEGIKTSDICKKYGLSESHAQAILTNSTWYDPSFTRRIFSNAYPLNEEQKNTIISLRNSGLSIRDIVKVMDLGRGTVYNFIKRNEKSLTNNRKIYTVVFDRWSGVYYYSITEAADSNGEIISVVAKKLERKSRKSSLTLAI